MIFPTPIRLLAAVMAVAPAFAQSLPSTPQTQLPSAAPASTTQSAQRAVVRFAGGLLTVSADNSSLNQILREIGRLTGMKITGGVNDERVYGTYGPTDPSAILSTLLRGTGSNMLLVFNLSQMPMELMLTPRNGGVTPPNPGAGRDVDRGFDDLPPQLRPHLPQSPAAGNPQQPFNPPPQPTQAPQQQPQPQTQGTPPDTTTQESPNGVKTPQQIYDQLMKLQQQQQKPAAGTITPQ